jgi:hypothetical protein
VLSVATSQDGTSTLISIVVAAGEAAAIASAGAAGAVSLVMLPGAG